VGAPLLLQLRKLFIQLYSAIAVLVLGRRVTEKSKLSELIVDLDGDRTQATSVALSGAKHSAIHYDCLIEVL
jgi:hypothetical protein